MEQSAASSTAPLFPDISALLQQVSAAQAHSDPSHARLTPTTTPTLPSVPTQQLYSTQASPFTSQPSPEDLRHEMETQLQRALLSMRAITALAATSQQQQQQQQGTAPLFQPHRTPTTGQQTPPHALLPESAATSHSVMSGGDTEAATAFTAGAPSLETMQWLHAALARNAGSGSTLPDVHPLTALTTGTTAQQAESGETTAVQQQHRVAAGVAGAGSTNSTVMAMAAREALAQVCGHPLLNLPS